MFPGQKIAARYTFSANRHFSRDQFFQQFKSFTRVVARLLHGVLCMTTRIFNFFVVCRKFISGAEGFEPLTSAVQSQIHNVVVVRRCSKMPANKHILSSRLS